MELPNKVPSEMLRVEMSEYFNKIFNDLLLKESGYFPDGQRPPNAEETVSEFIFTRVRKFRSL